MNVSIKETSATVRNIEVAIPQDALNIPFEKKVSKYKKEVKLNGFRQGQVPKSLIIKQFGDMIRQEAMDDLLNQVMSDELKKANIVPVTRLKIENFKDDKKGDITFTAIAEVDPVIDIKGYESLGIKIMDVVVSDEEINDEIKHLMQMWSETASVDRESKKGDVVVGNYLEVSIDGEKKDIPEEREFRSLLGESASPGFDEGLMGVKKGEVKDIHFIYPKDHKDEQFRGKTADFKVEVTDVREIRAPKMDEEFFKKAGVKDEAELRSNIQTSILNNKKQSAKAKAVNEAIEKIITANPFDVPNARVVDLIKYSLKRHAEGNEEVEPTDEQVKTLGPEAVYEIKKHRILDFIANKEKIKASQAMVDARIEDLAKSYNVDFKSLKDHFRQSGRTVALRDELRIEAAADYIVGIRPVTEENSTETK
ncbi:MAG: trigger factor [Fibrobacteraceae bacterium]|nr:trigger factor [Fibrobacteraceae bacterium]